MHGVKPVVYLCKLVIMRDILVDLHISLQVICSRARKSQNLLLTSHSDGALTVDNTGKLSTSFHSPERSTTPNASSDKLETTIMLNQFDTTRKSRLNSRPCGNLLPGRRDTNDSRNAPAFVARLKRRPHNVNLQKTGLSTKSVVTPSGATYIARSVKSKVESTVCDLDEMVLNTFAIGQIARVDKVGRAKLARPRFLFGVYVDGDHARRLDEGGRVDAAQANAATSKDGNR